MSTPGSSPRSRAADGGLSGTRSYDRHDPVLSKLGEKQCGELQQHLRKHLPLADDAGLIVVSPLRRTLQTAQLSLGWLINKGVPVMPVAEWQENSDKPCDTGSSPAVISKEFPRLDFSNLHPLFPAKKGIFVFTRKAVVERGCSVRRWLKGRDEKVILVVSHSAFLRLAVTHSRFANADYRVFNFSDDPKADELVEWPATESTGGGMARSPRERLEITEWDFPEEEQETPEGMNNDLKN